MKLECKKESTGEAGRVQDAPASTNQQTSAAKFAMGQLLVTRGVKECLSDEEIWTAFARHSVGDWGDLGEGDKKANEIALREGRYILSVYHSAAGLEFNVETPADRSATVVMLPWER